MEGGSKRKCNEDDWLNGAGGSKKNSKDDLLIEKPNLLIEFFVKDFLPLLTVNNEGFQEYLRNNYFTKTSYDDVLSCLKEDHKKCKEELKNTLETVRHIGISIDWWEAGRDIVYMTVSCHYFKDNVLNSNVLETRESSINIEKLDEIFEEWNITNKVVGIMAKNKVKEYIKKYSYIPCIAYSFNKNVNNQFKNKIKSNESFDNNQIKNENERKRNKFFDLLKKCRNVIIDIKSNSKKWDTLLEKVPMDNLSKLKLNDTFIWKDWYEMIESLFDLKVEDIQIIFHLNPEEWNFLKSYKSTLQIADKFYKKLFNDNDKSFSMILMIINDFIKEFEYYKKDKNESMIETWQSCIDDMANYIGENKIIRYAAFLDPRHNIQGFIKDEDAENTKWSIIREAHEISKRKTDTNIIQNVQEYLTLVKNSTMDPSLFWSNQAYQNKFPELHELSLKYLCFPKTCILYEIMVSETGRLRNNRRKLLPPENVDPLIFLCSFKKY